MTYTGSNPWTMMVMYFDTEPACTAVERTRWSQDLAAMAIRHFIMPVVLRHFHYAPVFSILRRVVFKLLQVVKLCCVIILRYFGIS